ncbi:oxidoreductase [Amycolatopsis anabasis]|uniref:oxidoreductase n=1 Tax=Amycolatopsis anabasis TaxID=1840409 RepID=UPI00131E0759|nr:oxidoreductase [Amycolatopsis anabasis]
MTSTNLDAAAAGRWELGGDLPITRLGYGAMQLAGPGVFGPPQDRDGALAVLRRAVELGVNHIDTSDYYGPHVVNELIKEALHPYPENLVLVTKVGARRGSDASWLPAISPAELRSAVHDNLRRLGLERLDLVNLRLMGSPDESLEDAFGALAELREQGLIRHLGLSNADSAHLAAARRIAPVATVQNMFNLADQRDAALVDECAELGIGYVPFFPLGGSGPAAHTAVARIAAAHGASQAQVNLAWLLRRSPAILLIPGTSSIAHLEENVAAGSLRLTDAEVAELTA